MLDALVGDTERVKETAKSTPTIVVVADVIVKDCGKRAYCRKTLKATPAALIATKSVIVSAFKSPKAIFEADIELAKTVETVNESVLVLEVLASILKPLRSSTAISTLPSASVSPTASQLGCVAIDEVAMFTAPAKSSVEVDALFIKIDTVLVAELAVAISKKASPLKSPKTIDDGFKPLVGVAALAKENEPTID